MSMHDSIQNHHVAVRVSSLEKAASFFHATLGTHQLSDPLPLNQSVCHNLFAGPEGGTARFAFIGFPEPHQPAFELIEFVDPRIPTGPTNTWEDGLMHWCFHVEDVDATLERVIAAGGTQFGDLKKFGGADEVLTQAYFRDPDGNLFQLLSESIIAITARLRAQSSAPGVARAVR